MTEQQAPAFADEVQAAIRGTTEPPWLTEIRILRDLLRRSTVLLRHVAAGAELDPSYLDQHLADVEKVLS